MYGTFFLVLILAIEHVFAHEFPEPVRYTPYDWRCVTSDGALVSNHTRQDKAIVACQKAAMANPGITHYIEAGRYRVLYGSLPVDPPIDPVSPTDPIVEPPIEPPVEPPIEPPLDGPPDKQPIAVYAYTLDADGELIDPKPLDGAHLARTTVYMAFDGVAPTKTKYWCCKSGVEGHTQLGSDDTLPQVHQVDLSLLMETTSSHELYADMFWPDGTKTWNNIGNFTVVATLTPPVEPPIDTPTDPSTVLELTWSIPTEREDGSVLPLLQLWGYIIVARHNGGEAVFYEVEGGGVTSYVFDALPPGEWAFAIKAMGTDSTESGLSEWVTITIEEEQTEEEQTID